MANEQEAAPVRDERQERMQRIRVGLTGLAVVLVLVFIATAIITGITGQVEPVAGMNNAAMQAAGNEANADEPLADLGVAPGASNDSDVKAPGR